MRSFWLRLRSLTSRLSSIEKHHLRCSSRNLQAAIAGSHLIGRSEAPIRTPGISLGEYANLCVCGDQSFHQMSSNKIVSSRDQHYFIPLVHIPLHFVKNHSFNRQNLSSGFELRQIYRAKYCKDACLKIFMYDLFAGLIRDREMFLVIRPLPKTDRACVQNPGWLVRSRPGGPSPASRHQRGSRSLSDRLR
jgi:hypothetical protein